MQRTKKRKATTLKPAQMLAQALDRIEKGGPFREGRPNTLRWYCLSGIKTGPRGTGGTYDLNDRGSSIVTVT